MAHNCAQCYVYTQRVQCHLARHSAHQNVAMQHWLKRGSSVTMDKRKCTHNAQRRVNRFRGFWDPDTFLVRRFSQARPALTSCSCIFRMGAWTDHSCAIYQFLSARHDSMSCSLVSYGKGAELEGRGRILCENET
eukprot:5990928-Amphidinium_carterae.1